MNVIRGRGRSESVLCVCRVTGVSGWRFGGARSQERRILGSWSGEGAMACGNSTSGERVGGLDSHGVVPSQAVALVGVPTYPNCIKCSEENLLAVASGHLVTILNPAALSGPRGFIAITSSLLFDVGQVQQQDLRAGLLLPSILSRDPRPGVRSIDWSPSGLAPNGGCLLAVCTTDNRVKIYRGPFCDFQSEWVEVVDLSEMVYNHCIEEDFREAQVLSERLALEEETCPLNWGFGKKRKHAEDEEPHHRKVQRKKHHITDKLLKEADIIAAPNILEVASAGDIAQHSLSGPALSEQVSTTSDGSPWDLPQVTKGSHVEVLEENSGVRRWIGGLALEVVDREALVRLNKPDSEPVEVWVQLATTAAPEACTEGSISLEPTEHVNTHQSIHCIAPKIRPFVLTSGFRTEISDEDHSGGVPAIGEFVEAWINNSWQEGTVVGLDSSGVLVEFSVGGKHTAVQFDALRLAPVWTGKQWFWKNISVVSNYSGRQVCEISNGYQLTSGREGFPEQSVFNVCDGGRIAGQSKLSQNHGCVSNATGGATSGAVEGDAQWVMASEGPRFEVEREDYYAKFYVRRRPLTGTGLAGAEASLLPVTSVAKAFSVEMCTTRPQRRQRRMPSRFRDGLSVDISSLSDNIADGIHVPHVEVGDIEQDGNYIPQVSELDDIGEVVSKSVNKPKQQKLARDVDTANKLQGNFVRDLDTANVQELVENWDTVKEVKFGQDIDQVKQVKQPKNVDKGKVVESGDDVNTRMQMKKPPLKLKEKFTSAAGYVARNELLSPLVLAWSPKCEAVDTGDSMHTSRSQHFSLLGAGMKAGRVSIWRMMYPPFYCLDRTPNPVDGSFLGFLNAHESWITSIGWGICHFDLSEGNIGAQDIDASGETLLLATGCADGSVKLWAGFSKELISTSCTTTPSVPFSLFREVVKVDRIPVTSMALVVLSHPHDRALLAIGKGSGSVEVWEVKPSGVCCQISLQLIAHEQTVTGLFWKFDGSCLYSCGQDSLKIWNFSGDKLLPLPFPDCSAVFPSNISSDLCSSEAMESFFGVALSYNCLALTTVRGIASDLLDQMYQSRSQKGVVQLFWLGSSHPDLKTGVNYVNDGRASKATSEHEVDCWELNIVSALEHLEDPRETLVLWDVIAAFSRLREVFGDRVVISTLTKWLSGWTQGQHAVGAVDSSQKNTKRLERALPEASCRRLQILNVLYRCLLLFHVKAEVLSAGGTSEETDHTKITDNEFAQQERFWKECLHLVEHELRQRLIYLSLRKALYRKKLLDDHGQVEDDSSRTWVPIMWVLDNISMVFPELAKLATLMCKSNCNRSKSFPTPSSQESCTFCENSVALESPEVATCGRCDQMEGAAKHQLQRCSVSMQVCPPVCLWHCSCCARWAVKQVFSMYSGLSSRSHTKEITGANLLCNDSFPSCPFCGISMQRKLPNFLLTPSLV